MRRNQLETLIDLHFKQSVILLSLSSLWTEVHSHHTICPAFSLTAPLFRAKCITSRGPSDSTYSEISYPSAFEHGDSSTVKALPITVSAYSFPPFDSQLKCHCIGRRGRENDEEKERRVYMCVYMHIDRYIHASICNVHLCACTKRTCVCVYICICKHIQ